jgi:hypothetical protein
MKRVCRLNQEKNDFSELKIHAIFTPPFHVERPLINNLQFSQFRIIDLKRSQNIYIVYRCFDSVSFDEAILLVNNEFKDFVAQHDTAH